MNIYVCIKQVPDTESKIKLNSDASFIDTAAVKWVMNPYDENAVEEAIKLKTSQEGSKVTIISVGPKKRTTEALRTALAMGADDAILVDGPDYLAPNLTAKALAKTIEQEGKTDNTQIFTGKLAIDFNNSSVSQMLAEHLNLPHATVVSKFETTGAETTVQREVEGGSFEVIQLKGSNVVAANKGLNTPRYASLPGIMKAKKKPLKEINLSDLGISEEDGALSYSAFQLPAEKPPVQMIDGEAPAQAKELVSLLRNSAKVI
ncbi:MAG: electron transfer flavoprotein subunit beta/FixA family protein [Bdellovibrionaceae bacterium]|jgi:electron transfer flavoprotein beta subunit|nr:electron transfer flavoprotein subunit beta/FixA family protein [Pseudobdellovibrionaceae bacterium]